MTNSVPTYWEFNGYSLSTYNRAVETFGGKRYTNAEKRGNDPTLPFRDGRVWVKKFRDAQMLTLKMWMLPIQENGDTDPTMTLAQRRDTNWNEMLDALDTDGLAPLVKRWWDGNTLMVATGYAEHVGQIEPSVEGAYKMNFSVDFMMPDPYFYVPVAAQPIGTIDVEGNATTSRLTITLASGQRLTTPDGNYIQYNGAGTATIDTYEASAKVGSTYVNGLITRNYDFAEWPKLKPGTNALTGTGTIAYQAAYR